MEIDMMSGTGNVRFRVHIKRQQAQNINISKHVTSKSRPQESGYEARKNIPFDTTARNKQHVRVDQW